MTHETDSIPFSGGNQRVRDQILVILSEEFPLTVKELYSRITKQGHNVTYQAVHKVIVELIEEGIIEKKDKTLQLSQHWIHRVKDYALTVDMIYAKKKQYKLPKTFDKPFTLIFDNYSTYILWIAESARDGKFTQGKPQPFNGMFRHALWPLRFSFMDFELLRETASNCPTVGVSVCDMPFDRWVGTLYKLGGIRKFKSGVKIKLEEDFFSYGDIVIRVKFSPETIAFLDQVYSKIGNIKQLFHFYLEGVDKKDPSHIEVTIERNPTMARMIENKIKQYLDEPVKKK